MKKRNVVKVSVTALDGKVHPAEITVVESRLGCARTEPTYCCRCHLTGNDKFHAKIIGDGWGRANCSGY